LRGRLLRNKYKKNSEKNKEGIDILLTLNGYDYESSLENFEFLISRIGDPDAVKRLMEKHSDFMSMEDFLKILEELDASEKYFEAFIDVLVERILIRRDGGQRPDIIRLCSDYEHYTATLKRLHDYYARESKSAKKGNFLKKVEALMVVCYWGKSFLPVSEMTYDLEIDKDIDVGLVLFGKSSKRKRS